jgi:hypothetical protein
VLAPTPTSTVAGRTFRRRVMLLLLLHITQEFHRILASVDKLDSNSVQ